MIQITLTKDQVKQIIIDHLHDKLGSMTIDEKNVKFLVKSRQNYRSDWEDADVVITTDKGTYIPEVKCVVEGK